MQLKQLRSIPSKSSIKILGKTLGLIVGLGVLGINIEKAQAKLKLSGESATFTGSTLTGYSVTVSLPGGSAGRGPVTLQYQDATGAPIGGPLTTTLGAGGVLTVPPPPIPAGATGLDNQVIISQGIGGGITFTSKPLIWYHSGWIWTTPDIKVDPLGIPGLTTNQSWFIEDTPEIVSVNGTLGTMTTTLIDSNFDLQYTDLGNGLFDATVVGNNSFMRLANDTYISFSDGLSFGDIQIDFNDGTTANGTFNFSAIGLEGLWDWIFTTDYTGATGIPTPGGFDAPAISISTVPEPSSTLSLLSLGVLGVGATLKRKIKRTNSIEKEPTKID